VDAAALVRDVKDIQIVFVGEGVNKAPLQNRAASMGLTNVTFLPFTPKERLRESFASADAFIISLQRGLAGYIVPSKLYGILASGRPYIAAVEEGCEVAAITTRHECGRLAEPGNAQDLADQILAFYHDRAMTSRCGANARSAGLSFDRRAQVARYYEVFQAVRRRSKADDAAPQAIETAERRA